MDLMHHNIMHTVSILSAPCVSPSSKTLAEVLYACMTIYLHRKTHKPIGPQVPHHPNSELSVPPSLSSYASYTSITYTYYIQCQSDQHYYVHLTPVKLLPSGVFPRLDQKGLDIRNPTRRMILPIPTNVCLSNIRFEVLLTEFLYPADYTPYAINIYNLNELAPSLRSVARSLQQPSYPLHGETP